MKTLTKYDMLQVTGGIDWNSFADGVCDGASLASIVGGASIAKKVLKLGLRAVPAAGWALTAIDVACIIRSMYGN